MVWVWCGEVQWGGWDVVRCACYSEHASTPCSCCLAGRAYPKGEVPRDIVHKVKVDVSGVAEAAGNRLLLAPAPFTLFNNLCCSCVEGVPIAVCG